MSNTPPVRSNNSTEDEAPAAPNPSPQIPQQSPVRMPSAIMGIMREEINSNSRTASPNLLIPEEEIRPVRSDDQQEREQELRRRIMAIHRDPNLNPQKRAARMQELMSSKLQKFSDDDDSDKDVEMQMDVGGDNNVVSETDKKPTFNVVQNQTMGCEHYVRNCKLKAKCCKKWFTCRLCHDNESDHIMNRHATEEIMCMKCQFVQPPSSECAQCKSSFGAYYCSICKFWDGDTSKKIYHCPSCGICRIGQGLGIDFFHCDTCQACLSMSLQGNHRCIERNLHSNCPICGDYMFISTELVIFLPCGHPMHNQCYQDYINTAFHCPICWKTIGNMSEFFRSIDEALAQQEMPDKYRFMKSEVLCNDCEERSVTKFHFLYHKCQLCGSYNTKLIKTFASAENEQGGFSE